MIYSIKRDSVARLIGLRNGDIIQAVDDLEIKDTQDLEDFEDNIDDYSDMTISILRRGKPKELVFNGQDNAYTINDVEP
jgi:S1-C subfamily serine protease